MNRFLIFLKISLFFMVTVTSSYEKFSWCSCKIRDPDEEYGILKHDKNYQEIICEASQYSTTFNSSMLQEFQYIGKDGKVKDCMSIPIDNQSSLDNVTSLKISSLPSLEISWLSKMVFVKLKNLQKMSFTEMNFHENVSYISNFLQNNEKLESITFQRNKNFTTMSNKFFSNLKNLSKVYIIESDLEYLPNDLFLNTINLTYLTLSKSSLTYVDAIIFKNCQKLEYIDLSYNYIASLDMVHESDTLKPLFAYTTNLVQIILQHNKIRNLTKLLFQHLSKLEVLNLSYNEICHLDCGVFESLIKLNFLYLDHNNLKHIWYCHVNKLESLFGATFSHNNITISYDREEWDKSPFRNSVFLWQLYLNNNQISKLWVDRSVMPADGLPYNGSIELKLSNNKLTSLPDITFSRTNNGTIILDVQNNCITSLHNENQAGISYDESEQIYTRVEVHADNNPLNCDCSLYELIRYTDKKMRTIEFYNWRIHMDNLKCNEPSWYKDTPIETFESKTYRCLLNESNIDYAKCPDNCSCWRRPSENLSTIIDCSSKNLTSGPNSIHLLFGNQVQLNLSNNLLSSMPLTSQTAGYELVTVLDLSHNNINHLTREGLPINLQILYMHNNKLVTVEKNVLYYLSHDLLDFTNLTLHENSFECDCNLKDLSYDLQNKNWSDSEKEKITCGPSKRQVYKLLEQDLCPPNYPLIITICIVLAFVAIAICIVIIIFYQHEERIKIWLYEKQWLLFWVTEEELDKDKCYDAFISYSSKDHDFVVDNLVKKLEEGPPSFKLCVHYRDFEVGEYIPNQITQSVYNSRRTILFISSNFINSDWTRLEFRAAHRQALTDRRIRVIIVIYGELPPIETFNEELQSYLKMYTYLEWKDPLFWPRLRFAMPHKKRSRLPQIDRVVITIDCIQSMIKMK